MEFNNSTEHKDKLKDKSGQVFDPENKNYKIIQVVAFVKKMVYLQKDKVIMKDEKTQEVYDPFVRRFRWSDFPRLRDILREEIETLDTTKKGENPFLFDI